MAVPRIKLGSQGLKVSVQGLGCMSMAAVHRWPKPEPNASQLIRDAVDAGVTFLDTSDHYGPFTNKILIGKALKGGVREKVELATIYGNALTEDGDSVISGDPACVRFGCEDCLKKLDVDCIDLYYLNRIDPRVPIEVTIGELKKLVEEGKIKYIGLAEVSASSIRRAHAVHPITAVQLEWSLWSRDVEEDIIPTCRELGIGIVAHSPLGRRFFETWPRLRFVYDEESGEDFQKGLPAGNHLREQRKPIMEHWKELALRKGCTPPQLALAWVHHQGSDICTNPGSTKIDNLKENIGALSVTLTPEEMAQLESFASAYGFKLERYVPPSSTMRRDNWRESETPPLSSWEGI